MSRSTNTKPIKYGGIRKQLDSWTSEGKDFKEKKSREFAEEEIEESLKEEINASDI